MGGWCPSPPRRTRRACSARRAFFMIICVRMTHTWPSDRTDLLPRGTLLKNTYELTGFVGEGGCGVVYTAIQHPIDRTVAVKVLTLTDEGMKERFVRVAIAMPLMYLAGEVANMAHAAVEAYRAMAALSAMSLHMRTGASSPTRRRSWRASKSSA